MPKEEDLVFDRERLLAVIDEQLEQVDLPKILEKGHLLKQKSIVDLQALVQEGQLTYEELVAYYLYRIRN